MVDLMPAKTHISCHETANPLQAIDVEKPLDAVYYQKVLPLGSVTFVGVLAFHIAQSTPVFSPSEPDGPFTQVQKVLDSLDFGVFFVANVIIQLDHIYNGPKQ